MKKIMISKKTEKRIDEKLKMEHLKLVKKLGDLEVGTKEYAYVIASIKELEDIQRKKDEIKNTKDDSRRKHLWGALLTTLSSTALTMGWFMIETKIPVNGKAIQNVIRALKN